MGLFLKGAMSTGPPPQCRASCRLSTRICLMIYLSIAMDKNMIKVICTVFHCSQGNYLIKRHHLCAYISACVDLHKR